jgi:lipopolysaccharide transport system ATP-binding protein
MAQPIISVEHLSKRYRIAHRGQRANYSTLREALAAKSKSLFSGLTPGKGNGQALATPPSQEDFWALKDVSFEVQQGEVLGVIGRNGAGKSTLLKILSRITEPTEGRVTLRGRIASLLEVGTGFHPELTGRENVYLNGAILGMSRAEIKRKFDEIVDFAGVEKFLDTPVKRYSSGMYVRLAFAVAAHLEPEILIVDEVLAVGDAEFQKKCMGKMQDVSTKEGRTVIFVSHNAVAIRQLTTHCILLKSGKLDFAGSTTDSLEQYHSGNLATSQTVFEVEHHPRVFGNKAVTICLLRFDRDAPQFGAHEPLSFLIRVRANQSIGAMRPNLLIFSTDGVAVGMAFSAERPGLSEGESSEYRVTLPNHNLAPGHYHCYAGIGRGDPRLGHLDYDVVTDTLQFEVLPTAGTDGILSRWHNGWGRTIYPELLFAPEFSDREVVGSTSSRY